MITTFSKNYFSFKSINDKIINWFYIPIFNLSFFFSILCSFTGNICANFSSVRFIFFLLKNANPVSYNTYSELPHSKRIIMYVLTFVTILLSAQSLQYTPSFYLYYVNVIEMSISSTTLAHIHISGFCLNNSIYLHGGASRKCDNAYIPDVLPLFCSRFNFSSLCTYHPELRPRIECLLTMSCLNRKRVQRVN